MPVFNTVEKIVYVKTDLRDIEVRIRPFSLKHYMSGNAEVWVDFIDIEHAASGPIHERENEVHCIIEVQYRMQMDNSATFAKQCYSCKNSITGASGIYLWKYSAFNSCSTQIKRTRMGIHALLGMRLEYKIIDVHIPT